MNRSIQLFIDLSHHLLQNGILYCIHWRFPMKQQNNVPSRARTPFWGQLGVHGSVNLSLLLFVCEQDGRARRGGGGGARRRGSTWCSWDTPSLDWQVRGGRQDSPRVGLWPLGDDWIPSACSGGKDLKPGPTGHRAARWPRRHASQSLVLFASPSHWWL